MEVGLETAAIKAVLRLNEPLAGSFSSAERWSMWVPDCPRAPSQLSAPSTRIWMTIKR